MPGQVGSSGRNTVRGPHTTVFDAALMREFSMTEKAKLEFRWEVFNVSNTPEFGQPSGNFNSGAGGQITTLSGGSACDAVCPAGFFLTARRSEPGVRKLFISGP